MDDQRDIKHRVGSAMAMLLVMFALLAILASCGPEGYEELKADDLKKIMDSSIAVLVVDNRSEYEYSRGHIPKAINVPQERLFALNSFLPKDKDFPIVFYCTGYG